MNWNIIANPLVVLFIALVLPCQIMGGEYSLNLGPPAVGQGGPNPVSIPPTQPVDYEFSFVSDRGMEIAVGISPGIFWGFRETIVGGFYTGAGLGLVINAKGGGPGINASVGYKFTCKAFCLQFFYRKAIGIAGSTPIFPHALRFGIGWKF